MFGLGMICLECRSGLGLQSWYHWFRVVCTQVLWFLRQVSSVSFSGNYPVKGWLSQGCQGEEARVTYLRSYEAEEGGGAGGVEGGAVPRPAQLLGGEVVPVLGAHQLPQLLPQGGGGRHHHVHHLPKEAVVVVRSGCHLTDRPGWGHRVRKHKLSSFYSKTYTKYVS